MNQTQALSRVRRLGGAARFTAIGAEKHVLDRLLRKRELIRIARGCYAIPGVDEAIRRAVLLNATVCCVSALAHYGIRAPTDPAVTHCWVPQNRGRSKHVVGVRLHYDSSEPERENPDVPVASLLDALAAVVFCLPYDEAVAVLDLTCDRPNAPTLEEVLHLVRKRSPRMAAALATDVETRTRSHIETFVRLALRRAGLRVAVGVNVPGVGEVDLLVEGRLIVELDGFAYHSGRSEYRKDRRRDRAALRLGFATARFPAEDCRGEIVVAEVRAILDVLPAGGLPVRPGTAEEIAAQVEWIRRDGLREALRAVGDPPRARRAA